MILQFHITADSVGRDQLTRRERRDNDLLCKTIGHSLWRILDSSYLPPDHAMPVYVSICQRCGVEGYVDGDYTHHPERTV